MHVITREQLKEKLSSPEPVALIEALPEESFREYHLPDAINIPVGDERFDEKVQRAVPDKDTTVVVYCMDEQCDASPKAAKRIEELGYRHVYDYEAGKVDWKEAGLQTEA